jgi:predicted O-methyltransferase YrrM
VFTPFQLAIKYAKYYLSAFNGKGHGMHSPFFFRFILEVLNNANKWEPPAAIEVLRKELTGDHRLLEVQDLGAGSRSGASKNRAVAQLARTAVKPKKYSQLLFRLVKKYKPATIIELGTSLGITTAYLSAASPDAAITTIEGSKEVLQIAQDNFARLNIPNVTALEGNFDRVLPQLLLHTQQVDLGYVDGNHRYEPTMNYFKMLLEKCHPDSILVFDDIHWSAEMEQAWAEIQGHPSVRCTVDIFFLGFVFFRSEFKEKQHFTIRF